MLDTTRFSPSCEGTGAAVLVAEKLCSWGCGCREKEGNCSHDDQEEVDGCAGSSAVLVAWALWIADVDGGSAPRACCACCSHTSRVLWSTGHFASSAACAPSDPNPFISAVANPALPRAAASLLPTRTVSRRSVCIMRSSSSEKPCRVFVFSSPEARKILGASVTRTQAKAGVAHLRSRSNLTGAAGIMRPIGPPLTQGSPPGKT